MRAGGLSFLRFSDACIHYCPYHLNWGCRILMNLLYHVQIICIKRLCVKEIMKNASPQTQKSYRFKNNEW